MIQEDMCAYCYTTFGPFEKDHVVPASRGGPNISFNMVTACVPCNREKSDRLPSEWKKDLDRSIYEKERVVSASIVSVSERAQRGSRAYTGAAAYVYENLKTAISISKNVFGNKSSPSSEIEIYKIIEDASNRCRTGSAHLTSVMNPQVTQDTIPADTIPADIGNDIIVRLKALPNNLINRFLSIMGVNKVKHIPSKNTSMAVELVAALEQEYARNGAVISINSKSNKDV